MQVWISCGDGTTALPEAKLAADVLASISRGTWSRPATGGRWSRPDQHKFQQGDASNLEQVPDKSLIRCQHLRRDVCAQAVRCGQRNGARDATGGRIVMGNWIPTIRHSWRSF